VMWQNIRCSILFHFEVSYCQMLCMSWSGGGALLAFSIHEFDAVNDVCELA
jgi:hypothetical protein